MNFTEYERTSEYSFNATSRIKELIGNLTWGKELTVGFFDDQYPVILEGKPYVYCWIKNIKMKKECYVK